MDLLPFMASCGLEPVTAFRYSGKFSRFCIAADKTGNPSGWLVYFDDGTGANFGSHRTGEKFTWLNDNCHPPPSQRKQSDALLLRQLKEREKQKQAAGRAYEIWQSLPAAPTEHPYLVSKKITANGARFNAGFYQSLVIPVLNLADELQSLQYIASAKLPQWNGRNKQFMAGCRASGGLYWLGNKPADVVFICEGFATACSIFEATGTATVATFSGNNLAKVAAGIKAKYPSISGFICADNDHAKTDNFGLEFANDAAKATGFAVIIPPTELLGTGTDFNDLAIQHGYPSLAKLLREAL